MESNKRISDCVKINTFILTLNGLWCPSHWIGTKMEAIYSLYSFIFLTLNFYLVIFTEFMQVVFVFGNIPAMIEAVMLLLSHVSQIIKVIGMFQYRDRITKIYQTLDDDIFNSEDEKERLILNNNTNKVRFLVKYFNIMGSSLMICWCLFPLFNSVKQLPFKSWYPFDTNERSNFMVVYLYQTLTVLIVSIMNMALDLMVFVLLILTSGQLDILNYRLTRIGRNTSQTVLCSADERIKHDIMQCVQHHRAIRSFTEEIVDVFCSNIMSQFVTSTIILCSTYYKMTTIPVSVELFAMLYFVIGINVEIGLYCYLGNEVIYKSQQLSTAVYFCNWPDIANISTRKLIILLHTQTRKPISIIVAKIFGLTLVTYVAILRSSYSFFAVLYECQHKE